MNNGHRTNCPDCGRELVYTTIEIGDAKFYAWLCDCQDQPGTVKHDIVEAREWDSCGITYEVEVLNA